MVAVIASLFVLFTAWAASLGSGPYRFESEFGCPSGTKYVYVGGYWDVALDSNGLLQSPVRAVFNCERPGAPFKWSLFAGVLAGGSVVVWLVWMAVVYVLGGPKAKTTDG